MSIHRPHSSCLGCNPINTRLRERHVGKAVRLMDVINAM